jgi:hypothetical protein
VRDDARSIATDGGMSSGRCRIAVAAAPNAGPTSSLTCVQASPASDESDDRAESTIDSYSRIEASATSYVDANDDDAEDVAAPKASTAPERRPLGSGNEDEEEEEDDDAEDGEDAATSAPLAATSEIFDAAFFPRPRKEPS